ncbi:hypothetical protein [Sporomusa aerivorans]|uniref:hypothetical protein n=1 Tax=Sporomusa aerivorans TaxID=204936 RepID=UPI00352B5D66
MQNPSLLSDDQLRQLLLESAGIIDSLFEKLHKKDMLILQQQITIERLEEKCERYNKVLFGGSEGEAVEKAEVSE